jgi:hypothetical protein
VRDLRRDRRKAEFHRRLSVFIGGQDMCFFRPIRKSKPVWAADERMINADGKSRSAVGLKTMGT